MKKRIFYSWQSDLPNNTNRAFINNCLENAITKINSDDTFSLIPFLDRDTSGLTGSPDIAASIFDKIDASSVFICDISIVNGISEEYRSTPNPNVLIELGYAISKLGWHKIIMIMNECFGSVDLLPFDLRGRRVLNYNISSGENDKASERKKISSVLASAIKEILINLNDEENSNQNSNQLIHQKNQYDKISEEALGKLNVIRSISYTEQKNKALVEETSKYLTLKRLDLAVQFALEITYTQNKNDFLIFIAESCITTNDLVTAQKAVSGITYTTQRNQLSLKLLSLMQ